MYMSRYQFVRIGWSDRISGTELCGFNARCTIEPCQQDTSFRKLIHFSSQVLQWNVQHALRTLEECVLQKMENFWPSRFQTYYISWQRSVTKLPYCNSWIGVRYQRRSTRRIGVWILGGRLVGILSHPSMEQYFGVEIKHTIQQPWSNGLHLFFGMSH